MYENEIDLKVRLFAVDQKPRICCTVRDLLKDEEIKKYAKAMMLVRINECLDTLKINVGGDSYPVNTYFQPEYVSQLIEDFIENTEYDDDDFYMSSEYLNINSKVPFMGSDIEGELLSTIGFKTTVSQEYFGIINGVRFDIDLIRQNGLSESCGFISAPEKVIQSLKLTANEINDIKLTIVHDYNY